MRCVGANAPLPAGSGGWPRLQFGFAISFHIIFASFTIGLAAVLKCERAPREWARARIPWLAAAVLVVLALAFFVALFDRERIGTGLADRLWGLVFPARAVGD